MVAGMVCCVPCCLQCVRASLWQAKILFAVVLDFLIFLSPQQHRNPKDTSISPWFASVIWGSEVQRSGILYPITAVVIILLAKIITLVIIVVPVVSILIISIIKLCTKTLPAITFWALGHYVVL